MHSLVFGLSLRVRITTRRENRSNLVCEIGTMQVAILDDYQDVALSMADWSEVAARAEITVFNDHVADPGVLVERLAPFDAVA